MRRVDIAAPNPTLARDERGAIALLGLFMAVFLVGAVYYLVGLGDAVLHREQVQDAADAAAFSSAVLHARGMNLIALINMTMAALLAILVALKLVETLATLALVVIAVSSFFVPGLATAVPPVTQLRQQVRAAHDSLRPPIYTMLETLHAAARAVRSIVPAAGQLAVVDSLRAQSAGLIESGIAVPAGIHLPTEDGRFSELCERASGYVGGLASLPFEKLPLPGLVANAVSSATEELAQAGAAWFCGLRDRPPSVRRTHTIEHPKLAARSTCETYADAASYDFQQHERLCAEAQHQDEVSRPTRPSGQCLQGCSVEPYEERATLARQACAAREGRDRLVDFEWQERRFRRSYVWHRGAWRVDSHAQDEESAARYRWRQTRRRPCGGRDALIAAEWNRELRSASGGPIVSVCSNAAPPQRPPGRGQHRVSLDHVDVVHVFGCIEEVARTVELGAGQPGDRLERADSDADLKVPQALQAGAELGGEPFQIRAAVFAQDVPRVPERVIEVASWRAESSAASGPLAAGPQLGRIALAQAEFFYATQTGDPGERASFLWNMRWQARLRRFRLPSSSSAFLDLFEPACAKVVGPKSPAEESPCSMLVSSPGTIVH